MTQGTLHYLAARHSLFPFHIYVVLFISTQNHCLVIDLLDETSKHAKLLLFEMLYLNVIL